jgi:hypothetical protein
MWSHLPDADVGQKRRRGLAKQLRQLQCALGAKTLSAAEIKGADPFAPHAAYKLYTPTRWYLSPQRNDSRKDLAAKIQCSDFSQ